MKKVLIVTPTLRSGGGVIRALKNMLALLPDKRFTVHVLPMGFSDSDNVELNNANILTDNFILTAVTSIYSQTAGYVYRFWLKVAKGVLTIFARFGKRVWLENILFFKEAKKYKDYDVVIAYQEGPCTRFVQYIEAPYKIAWIHCDYSEYMKINTDSEEEIYSNYQCIVCVSKYTLQKFQAIYPALQLRSIYIYNLLDKEHIRQSSLQRQGDSIKHKKIRLVSVGRLHPVKQFSIIPDIINKMLLLGATDFEWVLIGGGVDSREYNSIMDAAKSLNIGHDYFSYLGSKYNPYPYIKNSDILVSTSSSEACPFVVNEARVLGVPVVSNNYPSIYEFITDGVDGRIVSLAELPQVLTNLVLKPKELSMLKQGMKLHDYNNNGIIDRIIDMIEYENPHPEIIL